MNQIRFECANIPCPECNEDMEFWSDGEIEVNCYTKGNISIPGLYVITKSCRNPTCKWNATIKEARPKEYF